MAIQVWQPTTIYPTGSIVRSTAALVGGTFNDVDNGGFETGTLADWTYQSVGGSVVAQVANTNARTGLYAFYWPGGAGTGNEGGVECFATSEDAQPCNPGLVVTAKGWFRYNTTGDIDGSQARMYLQWYGAGMTPLSTSPGNLIKGRGNNNKWVQSTASDVAPAGAEFVAAAFWVTGRGGRGHVYVDDITWDYTTPDPPEGLVFKAVQPGIGTSDATEPVWPTVNGLTVVDATVTWEAMVATRITYRAIPILKSGTTEPTWPTTLGQSVADGTISWQAATRQVVQAPNSKVVAITASKVYAADEDIIKYSATVNPLDWTTADDAGYLPSGLNQNGSNDTAVLNIYRSSLVSFSSTTFQNWQVDPDPANMSLLDVMEGIGSTWQHAAQPVAKDLFYLSQLGVRTVGISAGSTNLVNGDVGMPIDPLVRAAMRVARQMSVDALGFYYPSLGQYMLGFPEFPPTELSISGDFPDAWGTGMEADYQYSAAGGVPGYTFAITGGSLPPGMTLTTGGMVVGSTAVIGTYSWEVTVTDFMGNTASLNDGTNIAQAPSVTGDAPDGTVASPYGPFSYGATGGTPPYTFSIVGSGFPAGLSLGADGAIDSGPPTVAGTNNFTVRATDSNGLYGEKQDEIDIVAVMMATKIMAGGTSGYYAKIEADWSVSWVSTSDFNGRTQYQLTNGNRIFSYRSPGEIVRTDDYGATTALSSGATVGGGGGPRWGWVSGNTLLIPGGNLGLVRRSTDGGASLASISGTPELGLIGKNENMGRWIGMWINNDIYYSDDDGSSFVFGSTVSDATYSVESSRWPLSDGRVAFGGSNAAQSAPKLFTTIDGIGLVNEALPTFTGGSKYITAIYEWNGILIVGTELGEVAYKSDGVWTLSSGSMGCKIKQIADNGFEVVMIGGTGPTDANGFIKSTVDLETFVTRHSAPIISGETWTGITT